MTKLTGQVNVNSTGKLMNKTVKELRQSGYKVKIIHFREEGFTKHEFCGTPKILAKGGRTELLLMSPEGIQIKAEAKCSNRDNYCRRTGVAISLGRALKELEWQRKLAAMKPKNAALQNELYNVAQEEVRAKINERNLEILQEISQALPNMKFENWRDSYKESYDNAARKIWENDKRV